jgi:hypothetical protein
MARQEVMRINVLSTNKLTISNHHLKLFYLCLHTTSLYTGNPSLNFQNWKINTFKIHQFRDSTFAIASDIVPWIGTRALKTEKNLKIEEKWIWNPSGLWLKFEF